jgi:hypothetical protein
MKNDIDTFTGSGDLLEMGYVTDYALGSARFDGRISIATENEHSVAAIEQFFYDPTAQKAAATGDKRFHLTS